MKRLLCLLIILLYLWSPATFAHAVKQPVPDPALPVDFPADRVTGPQDLLDTELLLDGDYTTCYPVSAVGGQVSVHIDLKNYTPTIESLVIRWRDEPQAYAISTHPEQITLMPGGFLDAYFAIPAWSEAIEISFEGTDAIAELSLYACGTTPVGMMQKWNPTPTECDLMLFAAHPDDEHLFFGGIIPIYAGQRGRELITVYLTGMTGRPNTRIRRSEALAGLWSNGLHNYPLFAGFPDIYDRTLAGALVNNNRWAILERTVRYLRKYKPKVVVTHDILGEYGHGQHRLLAWILPRAVRAAKDSAQYPDSAAEFGTWEVQKLYLHLYKQNAIVLDLQSPLPAFGGRTALEMARIGYSYHVTQHGKSYEVQDSGRYDCSKYGLYYNASGLPDTRNDFFDNVVLPPRQHTPVPIESPCPDRKTSPQPDPPTGNEPALRETPPVTMNATPKPPAPTVPAQPNYAPVYFGGLLAGLLIIVVVGFIIIRKAMLKRESNQ